jgi:hypothetical protein
MPSKKQLDDLDEFPEDEEDEFDEVEPEEEDPEEEEEKKNIVKQILAYHKHFPDILCKGKGKSYNPKTKYNTNQPLEKLQDALKEIEELVSSSSIISDLGGLAVVASQGVMPLGSLLGLKLEGPKINLPSVVNSHKRTFDSIIKQLICKYGLMDCCSAEIRLGLLAVQCVAITHMANSSAEKVEEEIKKQENVDITQQDVKSTTQP